MNKINQLKKQVSYTKALYKIAIALDNECDAFKYKMELKEIFKKNHKKINNKNTTKEERKELIEINKNILNYL